MMLSRRLGGGGAWLSRDSSAAVSRKSATSRWQVPQKARWASNSVRSAVSRACRAKGPVDSCSSVMTPTPQRLAQPFQAVADPGLDRAQRKVQCHGDLALSQAVVVGQPQRLPLDRGQGADRAADAFHVVLSGDAVPDVVALPSEVSDGVAPVAGDLAEYRPNPVDRPAVGHGGHPAQHAALLGGVTRGLFPHLDVDLLGHLLRVVGGAQHLQRRPVDPTRGEVVELGQGFLVARAQLVISSARWGWASSRDGGSSPRSNGGLPCRPECGKISTKMTLSCQAPAT